MYSLRSAKPKGSSGSVQTTIDFQQRKRNRASKTGARLEEIKLVEKLSPPKRTKPSLKDQEEMPALTRSSARKIKEKQSLKTPQRTPTKTTPLRKSANPLSEATPIQAKSIPKHPKSTARRLCFGSETNSASEVKRSLHGSLASSLLCRDEQLASLRGYVHNHLEKQQSGSLYISGAPGTGKTACLTQVLQESHDLISPDNIVTVNCMSMKQPQAIYSRIASELLGSKVARAKTATLQSALEKHITKTNEMILIVLDEVDQLDSRGQEILYTLFEWPSLPNSKLLLVGIANALDLTDRVLPRLQSHVQCRPHLLNFPPYSREEIATILRGRLGDSGLVDPVAVQFCARKVSAVHGDVRKALDICRRAIEKAEILAATKESCDKENKSYDQPIRITLRHIAEVISEVYGSNTSLGGQTFPLQQKLVACTLLCMVRGQTKKETTLGKLHSSYVKVCRYRGLRCEGESEFMGLCEMLATRSVVAIKTFKERRESKITLKLDEGEMEHTLQDKLLIGSVLEHGVPV